MEPLHTPTHPLAETLGPETESSVHPLTESSSKVRVNGGDPRGRDDMMTFKGLGHAAHPQPSVGGPAHGRVWPPNHGSRSTSKAAKSGWMTPPTHIATHGGGAGARPPRAQSAVQICRQVLNPHGWSRVRLLTDIVVLYIASSMALFADPTVRTVSSDRIIAVFFPIVVTVMMRARRAPDERLNVSLLDTFAYVLGVVSLGAMLMISVDSIFGGADPLALAPRLWLFAFVYLGVARTMLVSVRRQAMQAEAILTPTLIVGAGMIGAHLVKRLTEQPAYGLRPVAFLDSDPLPTPELSAGPLVPVLGGLDDLREAIEATGAQHVILAFSSEPDPVL